MSDNKWSRKKCVVCTWKLQHTFVCSSNGDVSYKGKCI